jgi:hypothetical protein
MSENRNLPLLLSILGIFFHRYRSRISLLWRCSSRTTYGSAIRHSKCGVGFTWINSSHCCFCQDATYEAHQMENKETSN